MICHRTSWLNEELLVDYNLKLKCTNLSAELLLSRSWAHRNTNYKLLQALFFPTCYCWLSNASKIKI